MKFEQTSWFRALVVVLSVCTTLFLTTNAGFQPFDTFSGAFLFMLCVVPLENGYRAGIGIIAALLKRDNSNREH